MVTLSPVGLAAAPVANQVSFLATFKEKLCRCVCATSTNQPFATVTYRNETPVLNGTTVFVPIVATITITTPNACKCQAETQVINEWFVVAFQGRTTLPTSAIPESHSVTYAGHLVLSTEKSGLTSEVEAQKANAEQVLASADFYPDPLKDEAACLRYAYKIANDPDGYDGMIFCRWTADAIGKAIKLDWEKFV